MRWVAIGDNYFVPSCQDIYYHDQDVLFAPGWLSLMNLLKLRTTVKDKSKIFYSLKIITRIIFKNHAIFLVILLTTQKHLIGT